MQSHFTAPTQEYLVITRAPTKVNSEAHLLFKQDICTQRVTLLLILKVLFQVN